MTRTPSAACVFKPKLPRTYLERFVVLSSAWLLVLGFGGIAIIFSQEDGLASISQDRIERHGDSFCLRVVQDFHCHHLLINFLQLNYQEITPAGVAE